MTKQTIHSAASAVRKPNPLAQSVNAPMSIAQELSLKARVLWSAQLLSVPLKFRSFDEFI